MNNRELLEGILKGIADDVKTDQRSKNIYASGKSAASLQGVITSEIEAHLTGDKSLYFQINGRKPGPFKDGIKTMLEWIKQKGITPKDPKTTQTQLAFLFARKISQKGNDIFLKKREGLSWNEIALKWKDILVERFKENLKKEINGGSYSSKA